MNKIEKKAIIGILVIIVGFLAYTVLYRMYYLNQHKFTYAKYIGTEGSAWGKSQIIEYKTEKKKTIKAPINHIDYLKIGDTVWIKYSVKNTSIVEVIDRDYKKYLKGKTIE